MSWVAIAVGVGSAAVGAYGAHQQNSAAGRANRGAGTVDITHRTDPWGPSTPLREDMMGAASNLYHSRDDRWGSGPPGLADSMGAGYGSPGAGAASANGGGRGGSRRRNAAGGTPAGGGRNAGSGVNSSTSQALAEDLRRRAEAGHPLYDDTTDYVSGTLAGHDTNQYRTEAAGMYRNLNDQNLQRYIDMLFAGDTPGTVGGGGGGVGGGGSYRGYDAGGGAADNPPVGTAKYIKEILDGKYLNEGNPAQQRMLDSMTRRIRDDFSTKTLPGINSEFAGASALGSNAFADAYRKATQGYTDSLADASTQVIYGDYNNRMADLMDATHTGASLDENAADNATARASARAASGASAYGADRAASTQMSLARLSALGDAMGLSVDQTGRRAAGMAGLSDTFSGDQRNALALTPELTGMDIRDYEAAFGASHSMDTLSEQARARSAASGNARAALALQRRGMDFDEWRYSQEAPYMDLGRYADVVNAASGSYGTSSEYGIDRRNASPMPYANVGQQAIAGGMAGYGFAQQAGWGSGGSTQTPGPGKALGSWGDDMYSDPYSDPYAYNDPYGDPWAMASRGGTSRYHY